MTWEPLIGAKLRTTMDSKVTALERAFQLARSGHMATVDDIRKRLKQEGYDERAVVDGGSIADDPVKRAYQGRRG